jgi:glycerate kinase
LLAVLERDLGIDVRTIPGAGAAGGAAAGLVAFGGAHLRPGVEVVMDAAGLRERIAASDFVVTGEGRVDASSLRGKVPAGIVATARGARRPVTVLCGVAEVALEGADVRSLVERFGRARALGDARGALADLAEEAAARAGETAVAR